MEEHTFDTVEFALINLVKGYPELYNTQDPASTKRNKELAWNAIAKQLNRDEGWCYAKWRNLTDYYKKRKKIYGNNGTSMTMKRWVYYDVLSFLDMYESSRDDSRSTTVINSCGEHSRSSMESNQNTFDETQYHSLDGVHDRARLCHFLGPLTEESESEQTTKRPRMAATRDVAYPSHMDFLRTSEISPAEYLRNNDEDHKLRIESVYSSSKETGMTNHVPFDSREATTSGKETRHNTIEAKHLIPSDTLNDCPHFHFCMSLAARFRKMNPGTATYLQMKIMDLILQTEFPDEHAKRAE